MQGDDGNFPVHGSLRLRCSLPPSPASRHLEASVSGIYLCGQAGAGACPHGISGRPSARAPSAAPAGRARSPGPELALSRDPPHLPCPGAPAAAGLPRARPRPVRPRLREPRPAPRSGAQTHGAGGWGGTQGGRNGKISGLERDRSCTTASARDGSVLETS